MAETTDKTAKPAAIAVSPVLRSKGAIDIPDGAHSFIITPIGSDKPQAEVIALDETDAVVAWCEANAVKPEDRRLTVKRK